jgi:DNA-binding CsgD family transcriptional regulator
MPAKTAANRQTSETAPQTPAKPSPANLSPREKEIFDLLLDGNAPKTISYDLNISYGTVKFHQKHLYTKLGVQSIQELLVQYKSGYIPPKRIVPKKLIIAAGVAIIIICSALAVFTTIKKGEGKIGVFELWYAFCDDNSTIQMVRKDEEINRKIENVITLFGTMTGAGDFTAGVYGKPDAETLAAMRTMKSFSFKFMGDGNKYNVRLPTFETIEGDHWIHIFETEKDKPESITLNVPDDFFRAGWSGNEVDFIQDNIMFIQVQPVDPGNFNLKFWDFKFYSPEDKSRKSKNRKNEAIINQWFGNGDAATKTLVSRRRETINGKEALTVTISGVLDSDNIQVSGVYGRPDQRTLETMRTSMKSLSFQFLGDSNRYGIGLPTSETLEYHNSIIFILREEVYGDHFMKVLQTVQGKISSITINVPDDLIRDSGEDIEFIQRNINCIEIHPLDFGNYQFKLWDITLK